MANPASGFTLTSVEGVQCTIVPRSLAALANGTAEETPPPPGGAGAGTQPTGVVVPTSTKDPGKSASPSPDPKPDPPKDSSVGKDDPPKTTTSSSLPTSTGAPGPTASTNPPPTNNLPVKEAPKAEEKEKENTVKQSDKSVETKSTINPPASTGEAASLQTAQEPAQSTTVESEPTTTPPVDSVDGVSSTIDDLGPDVTTEPVGVTTTADALVAANGVGPLGTLTSSSTRGTRVSGSASQTGTGSGPNALDAMTEPKSTTKVGPVVGGIFGAILGMAVIGFLFWFCRKRRRDRGSLLTPLSGGGSSTFGDEEKPSLRERWQDGPVSRLKEAGLGAGAAAGGLAALVKSKVRQARNPDGDSEEEQPRPWASSQIRNSHGPSVMSDDGHGNNTVRGRFGNAWGAITGAFAASGTRESQEDDDGAGAADQRALPDGAASRNGAGRSSMSSERPLTLSRPPSSGSLGYRTANPFADPTVPDVGLEPMSSPFADSMAAPLPPLPKATAYQETRQAPNLPIALPPKPQFRSQAFSTVPTMPPPSTRHPSTLGPGRESYRDTLASGISTVNPRRGKGRSDPFDLERPELLQSKAAMHHNSQQSQMQTYPRPIIKQNRGISASSDAFAAKALGTARPPSIVSTFRDRRESRDRHVSNHPNPLRMSAYQPPPRVSDTDRRASSQAPQLQLPSHIRESIQSQGSGFSRASDVSSLSDCWDGPGPDLAGIGGLGPGEFMRDEDMEQMGLEKRQPYLSGASSRKSVGKAM